MADKMKVLEDKIKVMELHILALETSVTVMAGEINRVNEKADAKIDADKVVSAINNSKESERIGGKVIHLTKDTLIEHRSINHRSIK